MRKKLLIVFLFFCFAVTAQTKVTFNYDSAGNQIKRELCLNCASKKVDDLPKEIAALTDDDLLKFSTEDVISYYPNPVKQELYLQWQLTNDNYVSGVHIYSITGQVLNTYQGNERINNLNIPFQNYPSGVYLVLLSYKDGGEKSIKIIKQ